MPSSLLLLINQCRCRFYLSWHCLDYVNAFRDCIFLQCFFAGQLLLPREVSLVSLSPPLTNRVALNGFLFFKSGKLGGKRFEYFFRTIFSVFCAQVRHCIRYLSLYTLLTALTAHAKATLLIVVNNNNLRSDHALNNNGQYQKQLLTIIKAVSQRFTQLQSECTQCNKQSCVSTI